MRSQTHRLRTIGRSAILTLLLLMAFVSTASAASGSVQAKSVSMQLIFNGATLRLPDHQYVFILGGTSYVPLRFVSYALQKQVDWNASKQTVFVGAPTSAQAGKLKQAMNDATDQTGRAASKGSVRLTLTPRSVAFVFDGHAVKLPQGQAAYLLNGTLYVPVRFVSEAAGTAIAWDEKKRQIRALVKPSKPVVPETGDPEQTPETKPDQPQGQGGGAGGTGGAANPTYEAITSKTEVRLGALENSCKNALMDLGLQYLSEQDAKVKQQLMARGQAKLDGCTNEFNRIVADAKAELEKYGYETAIIAQYRHYFENEVAAGRELLKDMLDG